MFVHGWHKQLLIQNMFVLPDALELCMITDIAKLCLHNCPILFGHRSTKIYLLAATLPVIQRHTSEFLKVSSHHAHWAGQM